MATKKPSAEKAKPGKKSPSSKAKMTANTDKKNTKTVSEKPAAIALYSNVQSLHNERHASLKLATKPDFSFAKQLSSILVTSSEFPSAALNYPIVFAEQEGTTRAYVVTGYKSGENLYVGKDGSWRAEHYIPAFVRRYPFIFAASDDGKQLSLCVDASSTLLSDNKGEPLYDNGKPSGATERALKFCKLFHDEINATQTLCQQIVDADVLEERSAEISLPSGEKSAVTGFKMVNERKLMELDDKKFIELRNSGALSAIYCHLLSMRVWKNLLG